MLCCMLTAHAATEHATNNVLRHLTVIAVALFVASDRLCSWILCYSTRVVPEAVVVLQQSKL